MKAIGEASNELERMVEDAIASVGDWQGREIRYAPAAASVVSPIHRAVESACFDVAAGDESIFLKLRYPDMAEFFDDTAVAESTRLAAESGVAPSLRHSDPARGLLALDRLGEGWRWGRVDDFAEPSVLEAVVKAKAKLHEGPAFPCTSSVFETIERYWQMVGRKRVSVPADVPALLARVREIGEAIKAAGVDQRPCHGDGVASNVMLGPEGAVQLVDFDMAANTDPYYDLGSLMVEAFQFAEDARRILEIYEGAFVEALYNRCRLYGIADDLMWALWGFISFAQSPRKEVEFTKYAEWRLLRCRWQLGDPDFEHWTSRL
ncbi:MAG: phosphotransferase [Kiloniellales bacterium]|nr:phosphotransferase [Kiloniellales bacterium]